MLRETDLFGAAAAEADGYLNDALDRFRITMALLPLLAPESKVLELGANPYFLTRLLRARRLDVTAANWFGERSGFGDHGSQTVVESGVPTTYDFDHFNVEADPFPYEDSTFDLVLFCEILEHLPADPIHTLAEIHRVLKRGGALLLTTPNATRLDNLHRMVRGENVYEQISGYGTYGRHNREYTIGELRRLLTDCGYEVREALAADIGHAPPVEPADRHASMLDRGENLFIVAESANGPRWRYPDWLYSSQHALRRVVRPGVDMGVNCELQSSGFHALEEFDGRFGRWTGAAETASVTLDAGSTSARRLVLSGTAPPPAVGGTIKLSARLAGTAAVSVIECDGAPFEVSHDVPAVGGVVEVELVIEPTWRPCDVGAGADTRRLGVVIHTARLIQV